MSHDHDSLTHRPPHVQRHLAALRERHPEAYERWRQCEPVASSLEAVWCASEFVAASCSRVPEILDRSIASGQLVKGLAEPDFVRDLAETVTGANEVELMDSLRRFRRRHMVRIAWRDLAGWADLDETLAELTALADACIRFAYDFAYRTLVARYGTPRGEQTGEPQPMLIFGMGKLGGGELNFSSDIDLVYLYPEEGQTDGERSVDNAEFFLRLGQKIAQLLAAPTVEGIVYRVDLRLRPFGDSGRLAVSFGAFENYLQQHGRDWERYAYVKARAITAQEHFPALYEEVLRPFVYRRYLDFSVFESLRDMKAMIAREVERRELQDNVKLGPGGIREIEFITQAFQLIRGGADRRLQRRELREVLPMLVGERLLRAEVVTELLDSYRFLRIVENRLQEWNDEQAHSLPEDEDARWRLARSLQYEDWPALKAQIDFHRGRVAKHFSQAVFGPVVKASATSVQDVVLLEADAPEERERTLRELGFDDPVPIAAALDAMRESSYYRRLDGTGQRRLRELLPRMLRLVAASAAPSLTLSRLTKILEMIGGRTVYLALLNENANALKRLVELVAHSQFLADQIAMHPLLLDELIDERLMLEPPTRERFAEELAQRHAAIQGEDPERQVEALRQFQRAALFRVAVADLTGRLPLMKVSDRLTDIAEMIVRSALALALEQTRAKHGDPLCSNDDGTTRIAQMIVIAYGKLGGLELGYGSDLDLVFLHDSAGEVQRTDGPQPVDNTVFFQRLAQRLVHLLTVHTSAGRLYEVDTRLRPGGNRGLIAQTLQSFREYEFEEAWTWEHQSLLRARAIAGDPALCARFEEARIEVLRKAVKRDALKVEVRNMRAKMRDNLSKAKAGQFDIKQDAGGVADLEFLVQYWMLKWADRYPAIVIFSDNIRQLESLASGNLIPQDRVDFLVSTYRRYRERLHRLSLAGRGNVVDATEFVQERRGVIEIWEAVMQEAIGGVRP
jgi:glutamate-ammonia-ligase adenylyltransferase